MRAHLQLPECVPPEYGLPTTIVLLSSPSLKNAPMTLSSASIFSRTALIDCSAGLLSFEFPSAKNAQKHRSRSTDYVHLLSNAVTYMPL